MFKEITDYNFIKQFNYKQLGNYVFIKSYFKFYAYEITDYENYEPKKLKKVGELADYNNDYKNYNDVYDVMIGKINVPDFSKVLN